MEVQVQYKLGGHDGKGQECCECAWLPPCKAGTPRSRVGAAARGSQRHPWAGRQVVNHGQPKETRPPGANRQGGLYGGEKRAAAP